MFIQKIYILLCALGFSLKLELPSSVLLSALLEVANLLPDFNVNIREITIFIISLLTTVCFIVNVDTVFNKFEVVKK